MTVSRSYSRHMTQGAIPSPPNWLQKNRFAKSKAAAAPWNNWYSYTSSKNTPTMKMEYLSSDCQTHTGLAFFAGWVKKKNNFLLYPYLILTQLGKIPWQSHLESFAVFQLIVSWLIFNSHNNSLLCLQPTRWPSGRRWLACNPDSLHTFNPRNPQRKERTDCLPLRIILTSACMPEHDHSCF